MDKVTVRPFTLQRLRPCNVISRIIRRLPSSSNGIPISASISLILLLVSSNEKSISTRAKSLPVCISSRSALSPRAKFTESIIMDLPAPVSPVNTLNPSPNSIISSSIKAIFFMDISSII